MTAPDPARKLKALLKTLGSQGPALHEPAQVFPGLERGVTELVFAFLLWEASHASAAGAARRLATELVDCNELRVCTPEDVASVLGPRYPRGLERAERLVASLNAVYSKEHEVSLAPVGAMPKREARAALDGLEGMVPFVAARLMLLVYGGHAFPVDERLGAYLAGQGVAPEGDLAGWMERQCRAGELIEPYLLIERGCEGAGSPKGKPSKPKRPAKRGARSGESA